MARLKRGYIYIIKADTGHYKIGRSYNVPKRMRLFAVKLPFGFEIINYFPTDDMYKAERDLHLLFKEKRANGEWFLLSDQNAEFLEALGCIRQIDSADLPAWVLADYPFGATRPQHFYDKNGQIITSSYPKPPWWADPD